MKQIELIKLFATFELELNSEIKNPLNNFFLILYDNFFLIKEELRNNI